ncbi:hypothetical protein Dester_0125 [Desulfurobacterium thermolithotrophum DSM 11699]|uniref:Lysylphosphatidylglycerol synthetase/UPF0104 n=1 Tax=Desulfurobacterium thermolithotrophum (strain DSM 11699 / BSA) TaxID=868864 RepID=F0S0X9_DESTD|nr:lysylphosphatidylglycerol synthase transmembrane domain-containing protein [Desulfurobacterium thermolithotrophum]ADY72783.1 hypothetical protein Dester_0125 [Desulfurobacterium thermolithotrophum DSM 11699]
MKKNSLFFPTLILIIFAYFLYRFDVFFKLKEIIKNLDPIYLIFSLFFYLLTYIFRAKRFSIIFPSISTQDLAAVMGIHTFFNNILPFRSGEASFPIILKKLFGVDATISSVALLFIRILDLIVLSLFFLTSVLFVATKSKELLWIPVITISILILLLYLGFKLLKKFRGRFLIIGTVFSFVQTFISFRAVGKILSYSFLTWLFKFVSFFFILKAGKIELNFFKTVFVSTFGEVTTILPIHSFGGFGTYEAGLVGGFSLIGVKVSYALTIAFYFHLLLLLMSGILALVGWFYLSKKLKRKEY